MIFCVIFENKDDRIVHTKYYLPTAVIKDENVMIDGKAFLIGQLNMN